MVRVCSECKWVYYPGDKALVRCRFCGSLLPYQVCSTCGETYPVHYMSQGKTAGSIVRTCKTCKSNESNEYNKLRRKRLADNLQVAYAERQGEFETITKRIVDNQGGVLKEWQWYDKIKHYNGCATCRSQSADIRAIIIRPSVGGKYTSNNVLPMCEHCYGLLSMHENPLVSMNPMFNKKATTENYNKIIKALKELTGGT